MTDGDFNVPCGRGGAGEPSSRSARSSTTAPGRLAVLASSLAKLAKGAADQPRPKTIHELRTTIRRMETLLQSPDVVAPRPERKLRKQLERMRYRAGKVRDLDIQLKVLRALTVDRVAPERARVLRILEKTRTKRRKRLALALADEQARGLGKRLRKVAAQWRASARQAPPAGAEPLRLALERFGALILTHGALNEGNLHDFRMDAKQLRYLAETAGASPQATSAIAQLRRMQDAIGEWHDWAELTRRAAKTLDAPTASPLIAALRAGTQTRLDAGLAVTADATQRLLELRPPVGPRKAPRPATATRAAPPRSAGASA